VTFKPEHVVREPGHDLVGVMRTKNVQQQLDLADVVYIPRRLIQREEQMLHGGDTLISSANSWAIVGKCCWVPDLPADYAIGGFVTGLRATSTHLDARYLYRWLSSPRAQALLRNTANQTTNIANLNLRRCEGLEMPLPSIEEQQHIVAILDQAHALCAKRIEVIARLDSLSQSIFIDMFGPEAARAVTLRPSATHPAGWQWVSLREVAEMATGHTPDRTRKDYWNGDIPWVSLPEIRQLDGKTAHTTQLRITSAGLANSSAVLLPAGTVCFSRTASVGFVTKLGQPMATSQDFHNWIPGPTLDPDYLMAALRTSRPHLLGSSDGSIHQTIYQRVAAGFKILMPPLKLQREFSQKLAAVDRLVDNQTFGLDLTESLFSAIQSRAFSGQL
jgi:type I restriction enzyme S subunit